jgi:phosphomannomutase
MNPHIFRKYDVRGVADVDLTDDVVERVGLAFGEALRAREDLPDCVAIGRDARASSPRIFAALARGVQAAGAHVIDLGLVPTPIVYFAAWTREDVGGAIQITGSHNPAEYNGFKMMLGHDTLHGDAITRLGERAREGAAPAAAPGGQSAWPEVLDAYTAHLAAGSRVPEGARRLSVVLDSGNGVAGVIAPRVVSELFDVELTELFSDPDPAFPNHHPDPTVEENLEHLIAEVRRVGADVGVAYDGDGDRVGVVDAHGQVIWGDKLLILLGRAVLAEHPGATVIGEVKCSQLLYDDIAARGGQPVMSAVGHSLIKARIKETGALLAGEMSGHIFFADRYFGYDDAVYATCRLLEILAGTDAPLSELLADLPETFATPEVRVDCADDRKFAIPPAVAAAFASDYPVDTTDGARINFGDGWGLVRASNTTPSLVLRVEAQTPARRDALLAELERVIASVG